MNNTFLASATTTIHAPLSKVWQALTDPTIIKQYFFGSDIVTDWKVGSPIYYRGEWQGKPYEDKGQVIEVKPEKLLVVTHWSPLSGVPDVPENYHTLRYELAAENGGTRLRLTQDNNANEQEKEQFSQNWQMMLDNMKKLLE